MSGVAGAVTLRRYADGELTAERAAELFGPDVAVADVVLATGACCGRLPDPRNAFTESGFRHALALLGLEAPHVEDAG